MEKRFKFERVNEIDYLDENLVITYEISNDAFEVFPEIRESDLLGGVERYGILMGSVDIISDQNIHLKIEAFMQITEEDTQLYREKEGLIDLDIAAIQAYVQRLTSRIEEYKDLKFLGDLHTHPITKEELGGVDPTTPSTHEDGDIANIVRDYEKGLLDRSKPFVFAVAGLNDDGATKYTFYRIVIKNGVYSAQVIHQAIVSK